MLPTSGTSSAVIDLTPIYPGVYDQKTLGSCISWAMMAAAFAFLHRQGPQDPAGAVLALYFWVRRIAGLPTDQDTGSTVADAYNGGKVAGFALETSYPYDVTKFADAPPAQLSMREGLQHRIQFSVLHADHRSNRRFARAGLPRRIWDGPDAIVRASRLSECEIYIHYFGSTFSFGGHGMVVIGKDDTMTFGGFTGFYRVRNQWGAAWGLLGDVWVPKALFANGTCREMMTIRRTAVQP